MKYLQNTFFNIFFIIVGLLAGAFIASWSITDNSGLAGGAVVFWGGAIGTFVGLIIGIAFNIKIKNSLLRNVISFLGLAILVGCILFLKNGASL